MSARARQALTILALTAPWLVGCGGPPADSVDGYAFFVAGHAYGSPKANQLGLHPPFAAKLDWLAEQPGMSFGVLLGDTVKLPEPERWDAVDAQLQALPFPIHLAVGNHDLRPDERAEEYPELLGAEEFEARYGPRYRAFTHGDDLFVLLDPNPGEWNIVGEQLEFLRSTLEEHSGSERVFVFFHQLLWWDPASEVPGLTPNSGYGRAESVNFGTVVEPLFAALGKPVYLFAGDVGAHERATPFAYSVAGDVHRIATGMGNGTRDNCVLVEVPAEGPPRLRLIALGGDDVDALGSLEEAGPGGPDRE